VSFCNTTTLFTLVYIRELNWSAEEKRLLSEFSSKSHESFGKEIFLVGVSAFGIFKMIISKASLS
jgi:hypothetical protein